MATIRVRELDEGVVRRLEERAAENRRSFEGEVRRILEEAAGAPARYAEFRALAARLRRETAGRSQTPAEGLIRTDRETGHRGD